MLAWVRPSTRRQQARRGARTGYELTPENTPSGQGLSRPLRHPGDSIPSASLRRIAGWGIELNPPLPTVPSNPNAWLCRPTAGEAAASKEPTHGTSSVSYISTMVVKADAWTTSAARSAVGFIVIYSPWVTVSTVTHAQRCRCARAGASVTRKTKPSLQSSQHENLTHADQRARLSTC
jgi:hypothetical protein